MTNLGKFTKKQLDELMRKVIARRNLDAVGEMVADQIRKRTRLGYGVEDDGKSQKKLKKLSNGYKDWRKKNRRALSGDTTPARSNLTQTGDMLDSIEHKVQGDSVEISVNGRFNQDKARWVTEGGRPFMNLSKAERNMVADMFRDIIKDTIKLID